MPHCPTCNYELDRSHDLCPACGRAIEWAPVSGDDARPWRRAAVAILLFVAAWDLFLQVAFILAYATGVARQAIATAPAPAPPLPPNLWIRIVMSYGVDHLAMIPVNIAVIVACVVVLRSAPTSPLRRAYTPLGFVVAVLALIAVRSIPLVRGILEWLGLL